MTEVTIVTLVFEISEG